MGVAATWSKEISWSYFKTHTQSIILTLRAIPFLFEFMSSTPRATTLNDRWYP